MKYAKQLAIIAGVSFLGEFLSIVIPVPVPGSVYGMLLMFFCLCLGILKLSQVEETADFLLLVMPFFFVAPGISIMETFPLVKDSVVALVAISFVTALLTMVVTGHVTQFLIRMRRKKEGKKHE